MKIVKTLTIIFSVILLQHTKSLNLKQAISVKTTPIDRQTVPQIISDNPSMVIPDLNPNSPQKEYKTAEITDPKIKVNVKIDKPTKVSAPFFLGMKQGFANANIYDREEGRVIQSPVPINYPEIKQFETEMNLNKTETFYLDKKTGNEIKVDDKKVFHGI